MCGRFTRYLPWSEIVRLYRLTLDYEINKNTAPAYNIAPTVDVPFVTAGEDGNHKLREGRWWLVPWWAKELPKAAMFNARIETVDTGNAFKDAFRTRRCLIPADGFYEWTKSPADGGKDPWHIHLPGQVPFSFAGLWAENDRLGIISCTIITAPAVKPVSQIHDRMPVILDQAAYDDWLDPRNSKPETAKPLLAQNLNGSLEFYRVGRQVNSSKYEEADCIQPINSL
jgi:putative SOS response-associated peptidase YedK